MKLTRLELSGFKSFADTVELELDDGITAIVGPNGCGKSNISDAVRWVLGEQRAKMLRGQRMDEVIFQGSAGRRPINVAEVSLCFDNSDGTLDVSYHEVVVTRRLTRSGQSDYLLNQSGVRLRDLQDALRGTGLGSDAGVVIEAQMIDRLLSDRAEERRSLFEEAAGIGLYRDRKQSTERRLEKTSEDLQRLEDLISEIQSQVRSLARQRGKAERAATYGTQRFDVVMTLARRDLEEFDRRHAALRGTRADLAARIPEARETVQLREREREQRVQERVTAIARHNELERRLGETRLALERLEGDLKVAGERLQHASARRERAADERAQAASRAEQAERELETAGAERRAAEEACRSVQMELDLRTANEDQARQQFGEQRERVRALERDLQQNAETQRSLAGERTALERELEHLGQQRAEADARWTEAQRELEAARRELETARAALAGCEGDERAQQEAEEAAKRDLVDTRQREEALRSERRSIEERSAQLSARRDALAELERRREGLAPAARELLAARQRFQDGSVLGALTDFVHVSSEDAPVMEQLLADWLHAVLVKDHEAVAAVETWHTEAQPGPLLLLPVHPGPAGDAVGGTPVGLRVDDVARPWVAQLLAGSRRTDAPHGAVWRANGAVYLPGNTTTGPLIRRAELDGITVELDAAERRLAEAIEALDAATASHREAEQTLDAANERHAASRTALLEAQGRHDDAVRRRMRAEREHGEAQASLGRVNERITERRARQQAVQAELQSAAERRTDLEEDLKAQQSQLADLEAAQEAAQERRVHWQVEEAQVSARELSAREREDRARAALDEARNAITALDQELTEIVTSTGELTTQRTQWTDTLSERRVSVQELETAARDAERAMEAAESALTAAEEALNEARAQRDRLTEEQHRVELEVTEAQGRRQGLIERIEGEWHKPIDTLLAEAKAVEGDTEGLRAEAQRLTEELERIGPVNPLAVEEHAEEVKRLDFLQSQRDDLVNARNSLMQALREIDQTAREMFLETFNAVRANFQRVFETLFEGGECDVRLADETDPLASEIDIHAAPRGKRTQRIHLLSSGERALVAISLLFSIYLAKPAPFCLLDEVDAPLDDANVMRFVRLLDEFKADTQFIVITHNPRTMQVADAVYGVTMQEPGVSTIVGVRLGEVESTTA
jgi:chromosome segregation protein